MSLVSLFASAGPSGFGARSTAEQVTQGLSLGGKCFLVTGCTSGLGQETLRVLSARGARVLATGRTREKALAACEEVGARQATPLALELDSPASVRACVQAVKQEGTTLDGVICNAGIMALPRREQAFGYELQFFTNHVGHFMLVTGLLDQLAEDARVVVLSSAAHQRAPPTGVELDNLSGDVGYAPWRAYAQSKMANILFVRELARRFAGTRRTANAVHPGVIATNLGRHMNPLASKVFSAVSPLFLKTIPEGAATQCFVATHPSLAQVSGKYFADCNEKKPRADAEDPVRAQRLWEKTEAIVAALP